MYCDSRYRSLLVLTLLSVEFLLLPNVVDEGGNSGKGDERKPESYYAYDPSVLAPAEGTVYETRDEISDTPMAQLADDDPSVVNRKLAACQTELRSVTAFVARTAKLHHHREQTWTLFDCGAKAGPFIYR